MLATEFSWCRLIGANTTPLSRVMRPYGNSADLLFTIEFVRPIMISRKDPLKDLNDESPTTDNNMIYAFVGF